MAPTIPSAKSTLSYPLYGADFDPQNAGFLLVGGGGGENRSGVGNKITLLNSSRRDEISEIVEIRLSQDEDSVTSLAVSQSSGTTMTALAGINSSEADQKIGKNEHLRSFRLDYPPRKRAEGDVEKPEFYSGKTEALGKTTLFRKPQGERDGIYQRIVKMSPSRNDTSQPVAAVSTGLAINGEIVVFRSEPTLASPEILGRIDLDKEEAADLDIWAGEEADTAVLSYCTPLSVFIYAISLSKSSAITDPMSIYSVPAPDAFKSPARPKLRCVRFLSPRHILVLANRPQRSGADLIVLNLDRLGKVGNSTVQKRLNKSTKAAIGMEVCFLPPSPRTGERQILIAVAGQDGSIELLKIDYCPKKGLGRLKSYTILRDIHPASITKLAFSTVHCAIMKSATPRPPRLVKLASVSVGQTVVVHTLTLYPYPPPSSSSPSSPSSNADSTRYVLGRPGPSEAVKNTFSVFMAIVVIGILALLLQAFTEIRLGTTRGLAAKKWVSDELGGFFRQGPFATPIGVSKSPLAAVDSHASWSASTIPQSVVSPAMTPGIAGSYDDGVHEEPADIVSIQHQGENSDKDGDETTETAASS